MSADPNVSVASPARRYPIRRAVLGGLGGVVGAGLLVLVGSSLLSIATTSANSSSAYRSYQLLNTLGNLEVQQERTRASVLVALADPKPDTIGAIAAQEIETQATLQSLATALSADSSLSAELQNAANSSNHWYDTWAQPIADALARDGVVSDRTDLSLAAGDRLFGTVRTDSATLKAAAAAGRAKILAASEDQRFATLLGSGFAGLALCLGVLLIGRWIIRVVTGPLQRLNEAAFAQLNGEPVKFVAERDDEVGALAVVLERLRLMVDQRYAEAQSEAHLAATMNKLSDLISFSSAEFEVIDGTVRALGRLVSTRRGDVQLCNASRNRLIYAGSWGPQPPGLETPVPVDRIDRCPAIRRAAPFVVQDVDDDLAVLCAAHPQESGSLACIPLIAMGQPIGVIHLESVTPITDETVAIAMRVAEQVAVALANTRLITTMEGLAMTDGLTGLRNARFFDTQLEQELASAERDREPLSVLMIDIDNFKKFNDTYGHPAGDEALRVFGRTVRGSVRTSDLPARYGGEEFVVALRHTNLEGATAVAEKLRDAVSRSIVEIGPGRYGRMTISVGVAEADLGRVDQKGLLASADAALYRAKAGGRNRVVQATVEEVGAESAGADSNDVAAAAGTVGSPGTELEFAL